MTYHDRRVSVRSRLFFAALMTTVGKISSDSVGFALLMFITILAGTVEADIYQWEYVNPADPSQGKQQSTMLCPDGAGVDAIAGADLLYRDLTMAYLMNVDLSQAYAEGVNLSSALLSHANLTTGYFSGAILTNADFTGAEVRGADFGYTTPTGFTASQLYSTASYQAQDLTGLKLGGNDLSGWTFVGQNLTNAQFGDARLTGADLSNAEVRGAVFYRNVSFGTGTGITGTQLYSTASYHARDLTGTDFGGNNLSGVDLTGQNLTNARFGYATLTGADFTNAEVRGATFYRSSFSGGTGLSLPQLYSTASYQAHDLSRISLGSNNLSGGNFAGQNLSNASLESATLIGANLSNANFLDAYLDSADLTGADVRGASFARSSFGTGLIITAAQLYSTASYQSHDLTGINLSFNVLIGWNFADQNLTNLTFTHAQIYNSVLANANLTRANLANTQLISDDFTNANLTQANLTNANLSSSNFTDANLSQANLTNASFYNATFTSADFTNAEVRGADFYRAGTPEKGITPAQISSTASYQARDMTGIDLGGNDLSGWNAVGQNMTDGSFWYTTLSNANLSHANLTNGDFQGTNLTSADLSEANLTNVGFVNVNLSNANLSRTNLTNAGISGVLTGADFTNANIRGTGFYAIDFTATQLYSTASYQSHDLTGIRFGPYNLTSWDFFGQNLTNASFDYTILAGADFTNANVHGTSFYGATGFTAAQLYSTASYQAHDLTGIDLGGNNLTGWNFAGQNITNAGFGGAAGLSAAQLYTTASYQAQDLTGIKLFSNNLTGWNFAGQNLTDADFSGATLTGAHFTNAVVQGARFIGTTAEGFTAVQFYSTASYQNHDVRAINLSGNNLSGWNFAGQNLSNALFNLPSGFTNSPSTLTGADFTNAVVKGANFNNTTYHGFTSAQLYSTASYQSQNLAGIDLSYNYLNGWHFAGQNLSGARFYDTYLQNVDLSQANLTNANLLQPDINEGTLDNANLTGADLRGAIMDTRYLNYAITTNLIRPNGHIHGLNLPTGGQLVLRDYDVDASQAPYPAVAPTLIHIDEFFSMSDDGTLRMLFEVDAWDSLISFQPGIPVTLGGTLELEFAPSVDVQTQIGRTIRLFDWTGVSPTGQFNVVSQYMWDLSRLYTTGEVTLVPEPSTTMLMIIGFALAWRTRAFSSRGVTCVIFLSASMASLSATARADVFNMAPGLTSLEFVRIGNPGNPADPEIMDDGTTGYGSVDYSFRLGKFEVTGAQYTEFLNAVAATDTYGLYDAQMGSAFGPDIQRSGSPGSYTYGIAPHWADRPVNYISFWNASRFTNWLHNGQPMPGIQDDGTTEDGAYTLNGYIGSDGTSITRNPGAKFWIPSENEWYKAAFYDPAAGNYYDYATGSDAVPSNVLSNPLPDPGNNASFYDPLIGGPGLTEVGDFENSESPFGTSDQGGNVNEWNDTIVQNYRGVRGGSYAYEFPFLRARTRLDFSDYGWGTPSYGEGNQGFRVAAAIPEPSAAILAALGILGTLALKRVRSGVG